MTNARILVVEDDEFLLSMYQTKLSLENFEVITALNGLQAVKIAQKEMLDLILLDLNLPEMNGFEVLENLKFQEQTKNIPVLVLTNYSQKEDIDRCFKLGAKDYLIKAHFIPSEVVEKIKKFLTGLNK